MSKQAIQKVAKLLRTKEKVLFNLEKNMRRLTKKKDVLAEIAADNEKCINDRLKKINLKRGTDTCQVYQALIEKTKKDDEALSSYLQNPDFTRTQDCQLLLDKAKEISQPKPGFFLKKGKAEELLRANPPQQILQALNYYTVANMLSHEDIWQVFCALRFVEDRQWLNEVFFKPYQNLKASDFEEREIKVMVLSEKWLTIGEKFVGKKLHHLSHLKELGIIFIIPFKSNYTGATLEVFTLILHYLYEIGFYVEIFRKYLARPDFGSAVIQALQGKVLSQIEPNRKKIIWQIIQRYLAKDDPSDPRLLEPHINPEAIHWRKAEKDIAHWAKKEKKINLEFWDNLDFVGDFFAMPRGYSCPLDGLDHRTTNLAIGAEALKKGFSEMLVSFDLIDNVISLSRQSAVESKYLYHQQEALWNEIFVRYLGRDKLEEMILGNLDKGYIELNPKSK